MLSLVFLPSSSKLTSVLLSFFLVFAICLATSSPGRLAFLPFAAAAAAAAAASEAEGGDIVDSSFFVVVVVEKNEVKQSFERNLFSFSLALCRERRLGGQTNRGGD